MGKEINDCSTCANSDKSVLENPCFTCIDDRWHHGYSPMQYSDDVLARDIQTKRSVYLIAKEICNKAEGSSNKEKASLQLRKAREDYTKAVMKAIECSRFSLVEEKDGRLLRV